MCSKKRQKFFVYIPKTNDGDSQISAFCLVDYQKLSMTIKVHKKKDAEYIKQNLERVLNGTWDKRYGDSLKKRLYLDHLPVQALIEKTTVQSRWLIIPLFYDVR